MDGMIHPTFDETTPMTESRYKRISSEPENPFSKLVRDQKIAIIPQFFLECGEIIRDVPVAYKTWGKLNKAGTNCLLLCHALTGSADASDWWGPLLGPGRAFDPDVFFIVCINTLGSPYGTASPCTRNPETGTIYGPEFPLVTVKDDARLQKLLLDDLGVEQIAAVVGGSMGGMLVLEFAYFGPEYVRTIVPLATCAYHSAWAISWGEAQRQSIYSDPKYKGGYYSFDDPPNSGLGAARMAALLTYRSRTSFEAKFGRAQPSNNALAAQKSVQTQSQNGRSDASNPRLDRVPASRREERWAVHNQGNNTSQWSDAQHHPAESSKDAHAVRIGAKTMNKFVHRPQTYFTAQSYLRYQASKFVQRFDPNCYIAVTRKLDTHDVARGRTNDISSALALISQPTLVVGILSDGLFTFVEQERIASCIPNAHLVKIASAEGHDAFLLEFAEINQLIVDFFKTHIPDVLGNWKQDEVQINNQVAQDSVFGEASSEVPYDLTRW